MGARGVVVQAQVVQVAQRRRRAHWSPDEELRGRRRRTADVNSPSSLLRRRRCFRATTAAITRGRAAAPHDGLQIPVIVGALHDTAHSFVTNSSARGSIVFGYEGEVHIWRGGVVDFGFVCMYELLGVCECVSMRLHIHI